MIVTLANFKEFIGVSGTSQDNLLTRILESAQSLIEGQTNRVFDSGSITDKIDGDGDEEIFLSTLPIASITTVTIDGEEKTAGDYEFDAKTGEFWNSDLEDFPVGKRNVVIVYVAGWTESTAPKDLQQAIYSTAAQIYKKKGSFGIQSESVGDYSVTYDGKEYPPCVEAAIEKYRIENI